MELKNNVVGSVKLDFKLLLIPGGYLHLIDCAQCCYIFPPSIIYLWNTFLGTICTYRISNIFFRSHAMWASVPKEALPRYHDDTQKRGCFMFHVLHTRAKTQGKKSIHLCVFVSLVLFISC